MSTFKVGDRVQIVHTIRMGWNSEGRMEASVGMVGKVIFASSFDKTYEVEFDTCDCDMDGHYTSWYYEAEDMVKLAKFKGNTK